MTERDDRSAEKVTGEAREFSRLAAFLGRELALPVLTLSDDEYDGGRLSATAAWAATGAMWLTGHPDGPPLAPGAAVVPALRAAARMASHLAAGLAPARAADGSVGPDVAGASVAGAAESVGIDVAELLAGRAAWMGLRRSGRASANGSCRLLRAEDGWVAVNLARTSDVEAVAALIERPVAGDPWEALAAAAAGMPSAAVVERATLLAIPAAALPPAPGGEGAMGPFRVWRVGEAGGGWVSSSRRRRVVVDLSAMWAGPLCGQILGRAGLRVIKVESTQRPDGARAGDARFFDWLHGGHESVALDLASEPGRRALRALIDRADVVIESSRPRALAQLGIDAEGVVASRPGVTWVSITGHGRSGPAGDRVAFGDDAAVAAGLVAWDDHGEPVFCGDAIADPITGLYAAVGALASLAAGGGHLLDVGMVGATAFAAATSAAPAPAVETGPGQWAVQGTDAAPPQPVVPPAPPRLPPVPARPLGADTARVLAELVPDVRPGATVPPSGTAC